MSEGWKEIKEFENFVMKIESRQMGFEILVIYKK